MLENLIAPDDQRTPYERFRDLVHKVVNVPKSEIERIKAEEKRLKGKKAHPRQTPPPAGA